jgi:phosphatidylinositol glycan class V
MLVGIGFAAPQVVAYIEYCTGGKSRPWCTRLIPSIYSWVQDHYWEVGFLRYWTLSNLPLFLLAGPMLVILLYTGFVGTNQHQVILPYPTRPEDYRENALKKALNNSIMEGNIYNQVMPRLALQQIILAVMAATSFHVQIINRVSSGYPVWYIVLASAIYSSRMTGGRPQVPERRRSIREIRFLSQQRYSQWIVRGMVMYAIIQGGLYASFLPPA